MATPLYKKMKPRGTSFYSFPSAIHDKNLVDMNDKMTMTFSKYVLLNIPEQEIVIESGVDRDQSKGVLNFDKDVNGPRFYNFQPGHNTDLPIKFSEQLIESLRNYVSNYDSGLRESRININTDFYNVNELTTPTEMIFWKWCRKLNLLDLEPAEHKIDWDKNLPDFDNKNGTDHSYFQKYLWKERDINYYDCVVENDGLDVKVTMSGIAKFKIGDTVDFSGLTNGDILTGQTIDNVIFSATTNETIISIINTQISTPTTDGKIFLKYHRLIECIGDVQAVSQVQTSRHNFTEVSIQIPHHAGSTPTILFDIEDNTNYYPGLEMPILPQEQQVEIVGSENTNSPIRLNPENYPGTFFGYFDTVDKTYKCNIGDKNRYSGDYYGINMTNNIGLDDEDYIENLRDFNSDNIDGLKIDFNHDHYLKMNLPEYLIRNFDEFNSAYFDEAPKDYYFNAILWYYDLDDGNGNITSNLFGIEFLNNPNDDDDDCDIDSNLITPYRKLVSNGEQDGYSYIFDFNLNVNIDNDVLPLSYDPTTIHNQFSFDLYQNILNSNAQIQEVFLNIVSGYTTIQEDLFYLRSQVMSDTDKVRLNNQIENLNELLTLYSTMQIVDSDTVSVETEYNGAYPTLKLNVMNTVYESIIDLNITDVITYNDINSGASYIIPLSNKNMTRLNIYNNNNDFNDNSKIVLNKDLNYKQAMEIYITPKMSEISTKLDIFLNFDNSGIISEELLIDDITIPKDLLHYDAISPENSDFMNSHYNNSNIHTFSNTLMSGITTNIELIHPLFEVSDYVYVDNFFLISGTTIIDYSGVYKVIGTSGISEIIIDLDTSNLELKSVIQVSYYKGWKINILRVGQTNITSIQDRYLITKELI